MDAKGKWGKKFCCKFIILGISDLHVDYDGGQLCIREQLTKHNI